MNVWSLIRLSCLTVGLCGLTCAQAKEAEVPVQDPAYAAGLAAEASAARQDSPAARQTALRQAVGKFREVIQAKPRFREAREHVASCLLLLLDLAAAPEKPGAIDAAEAELDRLADDRVATADDDLRRANFLTRYRYQATAAPEVRQKIFDRIHSAYHGAIEKDARPAARAAVQIQSAILLVTHASGNTDAMMVRDLYREAATLLEAATHARPELLTSDLKNMWGVALLQVGRLDHDTPTARRALQLLEESLQGERGTIYKRYNLACAHAVLGERDPALAALADALKDDEARVIYQAARTDPEWAVWRESPEFLKLLQCYDPAVDKAFNEGLAQQSSGERATVREVRADCLRKAYQKYLEATQPKPDFYRAHLNALVCAQQLFRLAQPPQEKERLFVAIRQQFKAAAQSSGADWPVYESYGTFLLQDGRHWAEDPATKLLILRESKEALEEASKRASFSSDRARVAVLLARGNGAVSGYVGDPAARRPLLEEAVKQYQRASQIDRAACTSDVYATWGVTQLELAKLDDDRFGMRRSIVPLQLALKGDPRHLFALYNVACAYSLLGQGDDALQYLGQCVQFETDGHYATLAATDPDFQSLRTRDDFKKLFTSAHANRFSIDQPAPLSGR